MKKKNRDPPIRMDLYGLRYNVETLLEYYLELWEKVRSPRLARAV